MERELGISYPTVRNRVEALVRALGLAEGGSPLPQAQRSDAAAGAAAAAERREILERLARHELSAEEAAAALRGEPQRTPAGTPAADDAGIDDSDTEDDRA